MKNILILIKDGYKIAPEVKKAIDKRFRRSFVAYVDENNWKALDVIDDHSIGVIMVFSDDHEKALIQEVMEEFFENQSILTPVVFVSTQCNEKIIASMSLNGSRFFLKYPIDLNNFTALMNNVELAADFFGEDQEIEEEEEKQRVVTLGGIPYNVADISRIEVMEKRRVKIYGPNLVDDEVEKVVFYEHSVKDYLKRHGLEKDFQQARKERFVNPDHVKRVRIVDRKGEVVMKDGIVLPASLKYAKELKNRMRSR